MILAGGYATRLRPLSYALPKLLFPVGGRPVLEQTIDHLSSFGVDEVILAVKYLADELREHFGEEYHGVKITYSLEPKPLGTGGPIAFARKYYSRKETLLAMNGDISCVFLNTYLSHGRASSAPPKGVWHLAWTLISAFSQEVPTHWAFGTRAKEDDAHPAPGTAVDKET